MKDAKPTPQIDKFKDVSKQVEADDSEEAFNRALKKVASIARKETSKKDH